MRRQLNKLLVRIVCLCCVCIGLCLLLAVGVTYARYQWEIDRKSYVFSPAAPDQIQLHGGGVSQQWLDGGNLPAISDAWEQTNEGVKLDFSVTNGSIDDFAQRDQMYVLQLSAGLGILDPENLTVTLSWQDEANQTCTAQAKAVPIEKGSFLYDTYGEGWVYLFYSGEEELTFTLKGGSLQYRNYTITVLGDVAPTLLELQVSGRFINS